SSPDGQGRPSYVVRPPTWCVVGLLCRIDLQVAECAIFAVHEQADAALLSTRETLDHEAGCLGVVDPHAHLSLRHFNAGVKPSTSVGSGLDRSFVSARLPFAQLLPGVFGP